MTQLEFIFRKMTQLEFHVNFQILYNDKDFFILIFIFDISLYDDAFNRKMKIFVFYIYNPIVTFDNTLLCLITFLQLGVFNQK